MKALIRGIGLDPGTVSFGLFGLAGEDVFLNETVPASRVAADPGLLPRIIRKAGGADCVVGPSGYGLPWVRIQDLTPAHVDQMLLPAARDSGREVVIGGMRALLEGLKNSGLPVVFCPGVIHLDSVPAHRKANRVDMGTADKVCAAALGVYDQARTLGVAVHETSFILVEAGGAFSAALAVDRGRIVDGAGGTSGPMGFKAHGAMDGELAYLLGDFSKSLLCSGGAAHVAGNPDMSPEDFAATAQSDPRAAQAWTAYVESLAKAVAALAVAAPKPREVLLCGRLCRDDSLLRALAEKLASLAPVRRLSGFTPSAKEAAQGAALLAEGLAGGKFQTLIKKMRLNEASGTALDHIQVDRAGSADRLLADRG